MTKKKILAFSIVPIILSILIISVAAATVGKQYLISSGNVISESEAEGIALSEVGISREDAVFDRSELDYERGRTVWEIELYHKGAEYSFDIDAKTGEILHSEQEKEGRRKADAETPSVSSPPQSEAPVQSEPIPAEPPVTQPPSTEKPQTEITSEKALEAALQDASLTRSQIRELEIEKDLERGTLIYEISFKHERTEYEYDIRVSDGVILHRDIEIDD